MKKVFIKDIYEKAAPGDRSEIYGWVHKKIHLGKIDFLQVRDKTGIIQIVLKGNRFGDILKKIKEEDVIYVAGTVQISRSKYFPYEIHAEEIEIISQREIAVLPFDFRDEVSFKNIPLARRLDYRWYDLRNPVVTKIFEILSDTVHYIRQFFREYRFTEIFTSKIVSTFTEGGANLFPIIYYDREAYLAQSPQFYKQMAVIGGLERVFEIGHVYRAELHHTKRHLVEFVSVDAEMAFIKDDSNIRRTLEDLLNFVIPRVQKNHKEFFDKFGIEILLPKRIPELSMTEAHKSLYQYYGRSFSEDEDLDTQGERQLGEIVRREYNSDFVFVTHFPWKVRPFYTMRSEENPSYTLSFDLIFKGEELVTGGQREHRYKKLVEQALEKGISIDKIRWYLEMFKYGAPPHGGFGMGLERLIKNMLGLSDIREASLTPRDPKRLIP